MLGPGQYKTAVAIKNMGLREPGIGCGITGHPSEQLKCRKWPKLSWYLLSVGSGVMYNVSNNLVDFCYSNDR